MAKEQITAFINESSEILSRLDNEIIEDDAINKQLLGQIVDAQKRLKQSERDATFQVAIVSDLRNDVKDLQKQYESLEAAKIFSVQEQERIGRIVKKHRTELRTIENEIIESTKQLKILNARADSVTKSLKKAGDRDKVIRESLADKKIKLQEEQADFKTKKAEMRKEIIAQQQINPKLTVPIKNRLKGYYEI